VKELLGKMETFTRERLKMTKCKAKVSIAGLTRAATLETSLKILCTAKARTHGQMATSTAEIVRMM